MRHPLTSPFQGGIKKGGHNTTLHHPQSANLSGLIGEFRETDAANAKCVRAKKTDFQRGRKPC